MGSVLRRLAVPAVSFLFATGLQVSGIEAPFVAALLWTIGGLWLVGAFLTWEPVKERLATVRYELADRLPFYVRSPIVRKRKEEPDEPAELGFLDFEAIAVDALKKMTKRLVSINNETRSLGKTFVRYAPRFVQANTWTSEARRALGREAGGKMDRDARRLEADQVALRALIDVMSKNYLERIKYAPAEALAQIRPSIVGMRDATAGSRPSVVGLRDSTIGVRNQNVQQGINAATDRLIDVLGRLISDFDSVTRFTTEALRLIDEKEAAARVENATDQTQNSGGSA